VYKTLISLSILENPTKWTVQTSTKTNINLLTNLHLYQTKSHVKTQNTGNITRGFRGLDTISTA